MRDTVILFVTGTNTGVGKTFLARLIVEWLRQAGVPVAAAKPLCSGGRADARLLQQAEGGSSTLDEINPWHFRAPLAPLLAARRENKIVTLAEVVKFLGNRAARSTGRSRVGTGNAVAPSHSTHLKRQEQKEPSVLVVEGAGGLCSPLGEGFDARHLISRLRAVPLVVGPNCLGVINQVLLTLLALPKRCACRAQVVLVEQPQSDSSASGNLEFLGQKLGANRVHLLPRTKWSPGQPLLPSSNRRLARVLGQIVRQATAVERGDSKA